MSTRHHVRHLCSQLTATGLTALLEQARGLQASAELRQADAVFSGIKLGGGAAAMHERQSWGEPTVPFAELADHEALVLVGLSLRAAERAPRVLQIGPALARLDALRAHEPDFFDELLLELSRCFHRDPAFQALLRSHAEALRAQEGTLRELDRALFPGAEGGLFGGVRRLLGVGGDPARPLRLVTGLVLLDAKEVRTPAPGTGPASTA